MMNTTIVRGRPQHVGHYVNDFFEEAGLGRPVDLADVHGHITASLDWDGRICGAAYAATPAEVLELMLWSGAGPAALTHARRVQTLQALAVLPKFRGAGVGTNLVTSISAHAKRDYRARVLVAPVRAEDVELRRWFAGRCFRENSDPGILLPGDVRVETADGHVAMQRDLQATETRADTLIVA